MKRYTGILLFLAFVSCRNGEHKVAIDADSTSKVTEKRIEVELKDAKVQTIYNNYMALKGALVDTKYEEAKAAAKLLSPKLNAYQGCENTALIADKIASAKDIVEQRKQFTFLSSDVIALFKHADLKQGTIYVQHCPMANHGDGGDWLSSEKKIQNPYYGKKMMECGGIIEEIKTNK